MIDMLDSFKYKIDFHYNVENSPKVVDSHIKWEKNVSDKWVLLREAKSTPHEKTMLIEKNKWCYFISLDFIFNWAKLSGVYLGSGSFDLLEISI